MTPIAFQLNGTQVPAEPCATHTTLLAFIRGQGLTGAKEGCAEGECGACTVLFVRPHGSFGSKLVPVNSCLVLLPMAVGHEVYTVEALASSGKLAEVQQAMVDQGGSQCGYCTPGFIVSMFAEQYRPGRAGPCDAHSLGGNLCRCTGYRPIREALAQIGPPSDVRFLDRLAMPAAAPDHFRVPGFLRAKAVCEVVDSLRDDRGARLVAGATDMAVESNLKSVRFHSLIGIDCVPELQVFSDDADEVVIGAALPLAEIGLFWKEAPPIFREWLPLFASPLIRNRATLGGNLATASPIGDAAPLLLALNARLTLTSYLGARTISLADFFTGYRTTRLKPGELILSLHVPKPLPTLARFFKVAKRRMDDISTVAAAFAITLDDAGIVKSARLAFGGVAATPVRALEAEQVLIGSVWSKASIDRAKKALHLNPLSDHRGSAAYRLAMTQSLLDKFWFESNP